MKKLIEKFKAAKPMVKVVAIALPILIIFGIVKLVKRGKKSKNY